MDSRHAELLEQTDREALGRRLRAARQARGLTQGEVARDLMSVAYLSRIEGGHRRPTAGMLEALAQRLDVSVESLLGELERDVADEIRLALDYAELSLESGQPEDAETHLQTALEQLGESPDEGHARPGPAAARDGRSRPPSARTTRSSSSRHLIDDERVNGLIRIKAGIALSRIYRETGDLGRAIECGERVMTDVEEAGLDACDEAVQLAVTVAAAHFERGDTAHAVRLCRKAIERAESLGSPTGPRLRLLERQRDAGPARRRRHRRPARRARPRPARRGPGLTQPRPPARRGGPAAARARPAGARRRAAQPDAGCGRDGVERVDVLGPRAGAARARASRVPVRRRGDQPRAGRRRCTPSATGTCRWPRPRRGRCWGARTQPRATPTQATLVLPARRAHLVGDRRRPGSPLSCGSTWPTCSTASGQTEAAADAYRRAAASTGLRARAASATLARS